jgi:predicted nucleotidyltransferase
MAKVPDKIIDLIKKFIEEARKDNINITKTVLFGSYAKGTYTELSDIDIAIVSDDFEGNRFYDNRKIRHSKLKTSIDLEPHTYRPEEFILDNPFVKEVLEYGIII